MQIFVLLTVKGPVRVAEASLAKVFDRTTGKQVFGPKVRRELTAAEILKLPAFQEWCVGRPSGPSKRQATKFRQERYEDCLVTPS